MITINPGILLAQIITFLAAVFIIWKVAWKPLSQMMLARQDKIRSELDEAAHSQEEARKLEEECRQHLKDIHRETTKLISEARQEGMKAREEIMHGAQTEAEEIIRKARLELESEKKRLLAELRTETALLSLEITEKALRRALDDRDREKLFQEILPQLDSFKSKEGSKPS